MIQSNDNQGSDEGQATMTISICPEGDLIAIYSDPVKIMIDLGVTIIKRASHVEPHNGGEGGEWTADMSPMDGPVLGPFASKHEALLAEVQWIQSRMDADGQGVFRFLQPQSN